MAVARELKRLRLHGRGVFDNRVLVHGILTGALVTLYALVFYRVGKELPPKRHLVLLLAGTATVALTFQPARQWLQSTIDRLVYGHRGEPFAVVAALGHLLGKLGDPEEVLPRIVETIGSMLQLPFVAVKMIGSDGNAVSVHYGHRTGTPVPFPMVYQGVHEGNLLISPRSAGEHFGTAEHRLLETLADQIAPVAHAVQLTTALRRSRERVVRSREEERRRLRRDLHDSLGPILSGLRLGMEGVAHGLQRTGLEVEALIRLARQAGTGQEEVRRLINDLRPDVLDSLGLVSAIDEATGRFCMTRADGRRTRFELRAQDLPGDLPAAVEVAAYRIVTEALHNVVRHANAETCTISLSVNHDTLEVAVEDDGVGLASPLPPPGVGTTSMRERAEEIGGSCSIANLRSGGTSVFVRLPLNQA